MQEYHSNLKNKYPCAQLIKRHVMQMRERVEV
jgi:hypothetical protein